MTLLHPLSLVVVVVVQIVNKQGGITMKRLTVAVFAFFALLAFTAPLVLAEDPPPLPVGGCDGPNCK
jgi:hypothetical protein